MTYKIIDEDFSVGKGYSNLTSYYAGWTDGYVVTPYGIVAVYAQGGNSRITALKVIQKGRIFHRAFYGKRFSHRGIVTKAKAFAKEICESSD